MVDARSQTGTAPDEQTAMRYPTRASEFDHRRLQVLPSPLHDPPLINFTLASVKNVPAVPAVLDKGHQRKLPPRRAGWIPRWASKRLPHCKKWMKAHFIVKYVSVKNRCRG